MFKLREISFILSFFICTTINASHTDFVLSTEKGEDKLHLIGTASCNFVVEFDVTPSNSDSKFGIVLKDENNSSERIYIGCDLTSDILCYSHWFMNTSSNTKLIAKDIAKFYKDYKRHVRIVCLQGGVSIYVDGEKIVTSALPFPLQSKLNLSFRAHDGGGVANFTCTSS